MTKGNPQNIAASVRQRLQNLARERKEDFQLVLSRYVLERLVYRIGQSLHRDRFVVKGAMLFHLWTDQTCRPTRDIDFLCRVTTPLRTSRAYSARSAIRPSRTTG